MQPLFLNSKLRLYVLGLTNDPYCPSIVLRIHSLVSIICIVYELDENHISGDKS